VVVVHNVCVWRVFGWQEMGVASNIQKEVAAGVPCRMILHAFNAAGP